MHVRTLLTSAATLLVGLGMVAVAAPANAASTVTVTSAPGVHHTSGCWYHPYTITASLDPNVYHWDIDVHVNGPDGTIADFGDYEYGYTTASGYVLNLTMDAFLCGSSDAPGTYTVTGVLETTDRNYNDLPDVPVYGTFTSTLPAPVPTPVPTPTTPPPAPVPTQVTPRAKAKATSIVHGHGIRVTMSTGSVPSGTTAKRTTWRVRLDGRQVASIRQGASDRDYWSKVFDPRSGDHKITVTKNGWIYRTFHVHMGD